MPKVSLHTGVKGQFGLGTGRAMGKALKAIILKNVFRQVLQKEKESASVLTANSTEKTACYELAAPYAQCQRQGAPLLASLLQFSC